MDCLNTILSLFFQHFSRKIRRLRYLTMTINIRTLCVIKVVNCFSSHSFIPFLSLIKTRFDYHIPIEITVNYEVLILIVRKLLLDSYLVRERYIIKLTYINLMYIKLTYWSHNRDLLLSLYELQYITHPSSLSKL